MWQYNYTNELYHYGVLGMKWGKRKAQNSMSRSEKKHQKILNSTNPAYIYKNRKKLTEDEFNKVYDKAYKTHELKKMAYGDRSVAKEIAISTGKEAAKIVLKTTMAVGTVAFLTKTETGKKVVSSGKKAVENMLKDAIVSAEKSATDSAKNVAKNVAKTVANAATEKRTSNARDFSKAVQNGNKAAKALNSYGKTVKRILR